MSKMTTRSTTFQHVLSVLDLDQEAQDILLNLRITNVNALLRLTPETLTANLPIGYVNNITTFKHWYLTYHANHDGQSPTDLILQMETEYFMNSWIQSMKVI